MAKQKSIICNNCFADLMYKDAYQVRKHMHRSAPEMGTYSTYYCEECSRDTDSFVEIIKEPRKRKKKK